MWKHQIKNGEKNKALQTVFRLDKNTICLTKTKNFEIHKQLTLFFVFRAHFVFGKKWRGAQIKRTKMNLFVGYGTNQRFFPHHFLFLTHLCGWTEGTESMNGYLCVRLFTSTHLLWLDTKMYMAMLREGKTDEMLPLIRK